MNSSKRIEFRPSKAMMSMAGETVKIGDKFELLTTYQQKQNGDWCIVEIEGVKAPGYDEDSDKEGFVNTYQKAVDGDNTDRGMGQGGY
jgi:hypothetical protein